MRTLCPQCRGVVGDDGSADAVVAEARCDACEAQDRRLRAGTPRREDLESFPRPALVATSDGRVVAVNAAFAAATGRDATALEGQLTGEVMACRNSRLPEGCGRTMHCRDCTVRRMVTEVGRTRLSRWRVPAYVVTAKGMVELCVTGVPEEPDHVLVVLEDLPPGALERG